MTTDLEKIRRVCRPNGRTPSRSSSAPTSHFPSGGGGPGRRRAGLSTWWYATKPTERQAWRSPPPRKNKDDHKVSPFRLVHDKDSIHAHKRLYATATPRLYTESSQRESGRP